MWAVKSSLEISTLFYGFWTLKNRNHPHHQHHHIITASYSLLPKQSTHAEPGGRPLRSIARIQQGQLEKSSNKGGFSSLTGNSSPNGLNSGWWITRIYLEYPWIMISRCPTLCSGSRGAIRHSIGRVDVINRGVNLLSVTTVHDREPTVWPNWPLDCYQKDIRDQMKSIAGRHIPIPSFLSRTSIESSR